MTLCKAWQLLAVSCILLLHLAPVHAIYHDLPLDQEHADELLRKLSIQRPCVSMTLDGNGSSEFPGDLFTEDQRENGAIILHFLAAFYCFGMIAIICGDYFLPSVDCICVDLELSEDVAGATFMALATSVPEFFIALIGTFITMTDIGVGAVVGSGMFNILGIACCGGLAASKSIQLNWWPLYRDGVTYVLTVAALVAVMWDGYIDYDDAIALIFVYLLYFVMILLNKKIRNIVKGVLKWSGCWKPRLVPASVIVPSIEAPVIEVIEPDNNPQQVSLPKDKWSSHDVNAELDPEEEPYKAFFMDYRRASKRSSRRSSNKSDSSRRTTCMEIISTAPNQNGDLLKATEFSGTGTPVMTIAVIEIGLETHQAEEDDAAEFEGIVLFRLPDVSGWELIFWVVMWPCSLLFYLTVPDCRLAKWRRFYPFTFFMCVFWIGVVSYMATWMIAVIGDTIGIPDSVMGLTFLAAGGAMPEAISSVIIARQGSGGIGFSNSLGCNILDICLCLALPWLIRSLTTGAPVRIESVGIKYNFLALIVGMIVLMLVTTLNKFQLNKRLGVICFMFYSLFLVISILIEVGVISGPGECV